MRRLGILFLILIIGVGVGACAGGRGGPLQEGEAVDPGESDGAVEVPEGVVYKRATAKENTEARIQIRTALSTGSLAYIFDDKVICGPALWSDIKGQTAFSDFDITPVEINIPILGSGAEGSTAMQKFEGALLQGPEEIQALARVLTSVLDRSVNIRKAHPDELEVFWALIPYDIEEPLFVLETDIVVDKAGTGKGGKDKTTLRFLLDMTSEYKVFWIEELSAYSR